MELDISYFKYKYFKLACQLKTIAVPYFARKSDPFVLADFKFFFDGKFFLWIFNQVYQFFN